MSDEARDEKSLDRELRTPIHAKHRMARHDEAGRLIVETDPYVSAEMLRKFELIADSMGLDLKSPATWFLISQKLAREFVPGFQVVYDDPVARALGLPNALSKKGPPSHTPEYYTDDVVMKLFDIVKAEGIARDDKEAAEYLVIVIAASTDEILRRPHDNAEIQQRAKTLRNRVSRARTQGKEGDHPKIPQ